MRLNNIKIDNGKNINVVRLIFLFGLILSKRRFHLLDVINEDVLFLFMRDFIFNKLNRAGRTTKTATHSRIAPIAAINPKRATRSIPLKYKLPKPNTVVQEVKKLGILNNENASFKSFPFVFSGRIN